MAAQGRQDKIIERIYIKGVLCLLSPMIIGCGQNENTDIDVVRDWDGVPFIPATTIAGVVRHYLLKVAGVSGGPVIETLFGFRKKDSFQSLIQFYNARSETCPAVSVRDGVALDFETKTALKGAKYDYEIIERGEKFSFRIEIVVREKHAAQKAGLHHALYVMLDALKKGKLAFGAKTRRGFGAVALAEEKILTLDMGKKEDVRQWIDFLWDAFPNRDSIETLNTGALKDLAVTEPVGIRAEFLIPHSLLIRHYSDAPNGADASHLQSNGRSVIPGTSWNGALRHAAASILAETGVDAAEIDLNMLFGFVNEQAKKAQPSRIVIEESVIEGGQTFGYTRNKVDRFTGGVVDSALFDEEPHYGGAVCLNLRVHDAGDAEIGLLLLALEDFGNGIQTVGGCANIGRGILKKKKIELANTSRGSDFYMNAFGECIKEAAA